MCSSNLLSNNGAHAAEKFSDGSVKQRVLMADSSRRPGTSDDDEDDGYEFRIESHPGKYTDMPRRTTGRLTMNSL